jgi:hypothetical protein
LAKPLTFEHDKFKVNDNLILLFQKGEQPMTEFSKQTKTFIVVFLLSLCLSLLSCGSKDESSIPPTTPAAGGIFNKFFPQKTGNADIVFIQEKAGFAEAKLKISGKEAASLSIADIVGRSGAADKFKTGSMTIAGYPAAESGSQGTALLVKNRFQVQVRSKDDSFTADDRRQWLEKFNLRGLENLK